MIWALHGNVGLPEDWRAVETEAGERFEAVDLYGLGGDLAAAGERLNAIVADAGDGEAVLLGYSLGGRIGLHALLGDGGDVWRGAVIVSAHTGLAGSAERMERLESDRKWASMVRERPWGEFLEAWNGQGVFGGADAPLPRDALEWRREQVAQGFERWSLGRQEDLLPRLGAIGVPVLWATGKRDERYGAIGESACARLADGRPMRFSGAGHRVPWESTDDFVREALEFRRESLW